MKKEVTRKDLRQFGIVLGCILGFIGFLHFKKGHVSVYPWFAVPAFLSVFISVFFPAAMKPVFFVFTKITRAIGWFNTRVILIIIYFLVVTPIGLVMRIFGRDPLDRKIEGARESYWARREARAVEAHSLENQF